MHRNDMRLIAETRLREARALLAAGEWSGAYYLSGYVVELGLKACLVQQFKSDTMPDKTIVMRSYTHQLEDLVKLAGLQPSLTAEINVNPRFEVSWAVAKDWSEASRYVVWTESDARDLVTAVDGTSDGVLTWVRRHW